MSEAANPGDEGISDALRFAVLSFNVDRVTAEVTSAFAEASIQSILVKGPVITTWLYDGEQPRLYSDTDLLLQRKDWARGMDVLASLGFEDDLGSLAHPRMESGAGHLWVRTTDDAEVDLHYTLFGIAVEPDALWKAFWPGVIQEIIGGREVNAPSYPARLLHIALHAVQHGGNSKVKPMLDLERAVARADRSIWLEARLLAEQLRAGETFAAGLRLLPAGQQLAAEIEAGQGHSADASIRLEGIPLAEGFQSFAKARGLREKLALASREIFPSSAFMRWWSPLAARGRAGLLVAYLWRFFWLAYRAVPGYLAWRRASRRLAKEVE